MNNLENRINYILEELASSLDISPTDYQRAVDSYKAIGQWIENGFEVGAFPRCQRAPEIYPQGSINLGTIVRPLRDGKEADYDIDLVCELQNSQKMEPEEVKKQVGDRIKKNEMYKEKLKKEGKRCWTLEYAETNDIGFHIDILPCIPEGTGTNIKITNKDRNKNIYKWKYSNPKEYADWFQSQNITFNLLKQSQKQYIFENTYTENRARYFFASVQDVPNSLVRTPLQRAIQIMKRHRDVYFKDNPKIKPISIIITTLAAHVYNGEEDIYTTLTNIVDILAKHSGLVQDIYFAKSMDEDISLLNLITRRKNNEGIYEWYIPNPTNREENFADKWHENNNERSKAFFDWLAKIKNDIDKIKGGNVTGILENSFKINTDYGLIISNNNRENGKINVNPSFFNVPYRELPKWKMNLKYKVGIKSLIKGDDSWKSFKSNPVPLPKYCDLMFTAETNVSEPFDVYWQVVNTGVEAENAERYGKHGLRGEIFPSKTAGIGGLRQKESTLYKGKHWIECFIVKDDICVARSGEYIVNII